MRDGEASPHELHCDATAGKGTTAAGEGAALHERGSRLGGRRLSSLRTNSTLTQVRTAMTRVALLLRRIQGRGHSLKSVEHAGDVGLVTLKGADASVEITGSI